ncbi:hypothetical protein X943_002918 [Babesia divergens]|uniref:Uncharacterized protein n=1 Tax=Babesia divergens TaxID=32595 RepID=A0AAD9GBZ3_BABDI|nr:hypothetical protein X943_002918 [Babesia divergens]
MVTDCQTLSAASILQQSLSAGPFTYGFVFKEGWENNIRSDLPSVIDHLTQSLNKLNAILLKLQPKSPGTVNSSDTLHSSGEYSTEDSQTESENDDTSGSSEGSSTASIVGASVGTLGGTAALGGLGYFLRGFLFGV